MKRKVEVAPTKVLKDGWITRLIAFFVAKSKSQESHDNTKKDARPDVSTCTPENTERLFRKGQEIVNRMDIENGLIYRKVNTLTIYQSFLVMAYIMALSEQEHPLSFIIPLTIGFAGLVSMIMFGFAFDRTYRYVEYYKGQYDSFLTNLNGNPNKKWFVGLPDKNDSVFDNSYRTKKLNLFVFIVLSCIWLLLLAVQIMQLFHPVFFPKGYSLLIMAILIFILITLIAVLIRLVIKHCRYVKS